MAFRASPGQHNADRASIHSAQLRVRETRDIGMAVHTFEIHLPVHRGGKAFRIDGQIEFFSAFQRQDHTFHPVADQALVVVKLFLRMFDTQRELDVRSGRFCPGRCRRKQEGQDTKSQHNDERCTNLEQVGSLMHLHTLPFLSILALSRRAGQ